MKKTILLAAITMTALFTGCTSSDNGDTKNTIIEPLIVNSVVATTGYDKDYMIVDTDKGEYLVLGVGPLMYADEHYIKTTEYTTYSTVELCGDNDCYPLTIDPSVQPSTPTYDEDGNEIIID